VPACRMAAPATRSQHPVEHIAAQTGFGSPTAFRDRFKRTAGVSPQSYRRSFSSNRTSRRTDLFRHDFVGGYRALLPDAEGKTTDHLKEAHRQEVKCVVSS
jgi:hypothetical protein